MKRVRSWAFVGLAIVLAFFVFVKPELSYKQQMIAVRTDELLTPPTPEATSSFFYLRLRQEAFEWSKIVANFTPLISLILAYVLKGKR